MMLNGDENDHYHDGIEADDDVEWRWKNDDCDVIEVDDVEWQWKIMIMTILKRMMMLGGDENDDWDYWIG